MIEAADPIEELVREVYTDPVIVESIMRDIVEETKAMFSTAIDELKGKPDAK